MKSTEKLYDIKDRDEKSLNNIKELESKKADIESKISSLNQIRRMLTSQNFDKMISTTAAGFQDGMFTATVSELKDLYLKRREMALIYKPNSEPMVEINKLIRDAYTNSNGILGSYYSGYLEEIGKIKTKVGEMNSDLNSYPEKERKYLDAEREYNLVEATYNSLLSRQNETQLKIIGNQSDINVIDPAKNICQSAIGPNIKAVKAGIIGGTGYTGS